MHVAHFIQRYPPALGGSEAYFARLSRHLASSGDQVTVWTSNALALEAFWSRAGQICNASTLPDKQGVNEDSVAVRRYPLWRFPARRFLLKALSLFPNRYWQCLTQPCNPICFGMRRDAKNYDGPLNLVHASAFPYTWPIVCALTLARRRRVPFVLTPFLHLGDPDDPRDPIRRSYTAPHLRWLLHQADAVFVQTPSERAAVVALGVAENRVILQGLGVDPAECTGGDRQRARAQWQVRPEEVVVGHLANLSWEKGTNDLVQATAQAPVRLVLAGPEMPNFQHFWRSGSISDRRPQVLRLGVLDEKQKRDFFAGIDVFALPSRSDSFGLVLLEAWANGVACVGYRAGGIADVIRHEQDGLLVPCGDIGGLAHALGRLAEDADLRTRQGDQGRQRLPREFRWQDKLELVRETDVRLISEPRS
ncbi:MAG: glycosyltransferase family 4 protein [Gemmataceae bacterium]|nr:glycosyltransferase family 4 protein [Gemmataceae bacterium]